MAEQELINYIKDTKAQGFSNDEIKQALLGSGWDEKEINAGFTAAAKDQSETKSRALASTQGFFNRHKRLLLTSLAVVIALPVLAYAGAFIYQNLSEESSQPQQTTEDELEQQRAEQERLQLEKERELRLATLRDEERLADITAIQAALQTYFEQSESYPESLSSLTDQDLLSSIPQDPSTNKPYLYTPLGNPPSFYSLSFVLETDIGTLQAGLISATSEFQLQADTIQEQEKIVQGQSTKADFLPLEITDLSNTSFYPGEEVALRISGGEGSNLTSVVLTLEELKLIDRIPPFNISFSSPTTPGEYEVQIYGFDKAGNNYQTTTQLRVR